MERKYYYCIALQLNIFKRVTIGYLKILLKTFKKKKNI